MGLRYGPGFHAQPGQSVDNAAYEAYLGRWSRLFVPSLLEAAAVGEAECVLDVATGPGIAAEQALSTSRVIGVDISESMLRSARARLGYRVVVADGQSLPFRDSSFDAVICQLGLQFFSNPAAGLAEARRVLRPGRRAAACVISTPDRAPVWGFLAEALCRELPELRDTFLASFCLSDADALAGLFESAGFVEVTVSRQVREGAVESVDTYWRGVTAGMGILPQAYRFLDAPRRAAVRDEVDQRLSAFVRDGRLVLPLEILIAAGRA